MTFTPEDRSRGLSPLGEQILPAYMTANGNFAVWCEYCQDWHIHGPVEGGRTPHCDVPYTHRRTGYYLKYAGPLTVEILARHQPRRRKGYTTTKPKPMKPKRKWKATVSGGV